MRSIKYFDVLECYLVPHIEGSLPSGVKADHRKVIEERVFISSKSFLFEITNADIYQA